MGELKTVEITSNLKQKNYIFLSHISVDYKNYVGFLGAELPCFVLSVIDFLILGANLNVKYSNSSSLACSEIVVFRRSIIS